MKYTDLEMIAIHLEKIVNLKNRKKLCKWYQFGTKRSISKSVALRKSQIKTLIHKIAAKTK